ncbi:hypothetical protein F8388_006663, partial [Cannabis sativa]
MSESKTSVKLHILDISEPELDPSSLSSLAETCKTWGFFHITNHGISSDLYNKICSLSNDLFSLPSETKLKLGPFSSIKTYTPHFLASPYFESLRILLMCLGDDFKNKFFESEFNKCHGYLRINNYSAPESIEDEVEGLGMHTDMSCVTIVYQDKIGGLQVRSKEGKWMDISPCEGTLLVNIGDMLQAWSNEKLRSSAHRVVLRRPQNRFSIAFFWCFEDDKVILAPNDVVGKENKRIYNPFVCLDYLKFRENNEKGKFEKVGFTVKDFAGVKVWASTVITGLASTLEKFDLVGFMRETLPVMELEV